MDEITSELPKPTPSYRFRLSLDSDEVSKSVISTAIDYRRNRAFLRLSDWDAVDRWVYEVCRVGFSEAVLHVLNNDREIVRTLRMSKGTIIEHRCSFSYESSERLSHYLDVRFERIDRID